MPATVRMAWPTGKMLTSTSKLTKSSCALMRNKSFGETAAGMFEKLLQLGSSLNSIGSLVSSIMEHSLGVQIKEDLNMTIDDDTVKNTLGTNWLDVIMAKRSKRKCGRGAATFDNEG
ncbi:unnamed protein product, partial [Ectocarpus sp. 4 AP-2014]